MRCPQCSSHLETTSYRRIEVDYCGSCRGMWLDFAELDQLEDEAYNADEHKGSLVFSSDVSTRSCPRCNRQLRRFRYRLHSLEIEFCESRHGFWLDEDEAEQVLDLMRTRRRRFRRKLAAEAEWNRMMRRMRLELSFRKLIGRLKDYFKRRT